MFLTEVMVRTAVAEGLLTDVNSPDVCLIGLNCPDCGAVGFPYSPGCPRCGELNCREAPLSDVGSLWTWTTQEFRPPSPPYVGDDAESFVPFLVGYVDLPEGLRVETRLTNCDASSITIGAPMRLALLRLRADADGNEIVTFAFEPDTVSQ